MQTRRIQPAAHLQPARQPARHPAAILRRLPLSERIYDAAVLHTGPYTGGLQMACALETDDASAIRQLCETFEMDLEEVNRALLRVLADLEVERK